MAQIADGKVVQVIGPVLDVEFPAEAVPEIYTALRIDEESGDFPVRLTAEVQQHIGRNQVRAVAMSSTDGVVRGARVRNLGGPISVPVGQACLGRVERQLGALIAVGHAAGVDHFQQQDAGHHRQQRGDHHDADEGGASLGNVVSSHCRSLLGVASTRRERVKS